MSGQSTWTPKSSIGRWFESRLPIGGLVHSSFIAYPTPRNLNYWWTFGAILSFMLGAQIAHRRRARDALHARSHDGLHFRRAHHARRELWLAAALSALQRRVDVLPRRLHPYLPWHVLRLLQGPARGSLAARRDHLPPDDGHRLHGLRPALGPDVVLGRHGHHQPVQRHPARRRADRHLAVGRLFGRQPDAEPLLLAALPPAVHAGRRRRAACLGACMSPARTTRPVSRSSRPRTRCRSRPMRR